MTEKYKISPSVSLRIDDADLNIFYELDLELSLRYARKKGNLANLISWILAIHRVKEYCLSVPHQSQRDTRKSTIQRDNQKIRTPDGYFRLLG